MQHCVTVSPPLVHLCLTVESHMHTLRPRGVLDLPSGQLYKYLSHLFSTVVLQVPFVLILLFLEFTHVKLGTLKRDPSDPSVEFC